MILAKTSSLVALPQAEPNLDRVFQVLAALLESSRLEQPEQQQGDANSRKRRMRTPQQKEGRLREQLEQVRVLFPSLSLEHEHQTTKDDSAPRDRSHVEEHATSLLARPVTMKVSNTTLKDEPEALSLLLEGDSEDTSTTEAPQVLLENVYKSFAVLVESRIRAYVTLLRNSSAKQKQQPGGTGTTTDMNERLDRLMLVAAAVYAERMETCFELRSTDEDAGMDLEDDSQHSSSSSSAATSTPLTMQVSFDLVMPRPSGEKQVVNISVEAPGEIQGGSLCKKIDVVEVKLDTRKVLLGLMEQAAKVVTAVAEIASTDAAVSRDTQSSMARSASFLAMPPPSPRCGSRPSGSSASSSSSALGKRTLQQQQQAAARRNLGLELLSHAAAVVPIVSPDVGQQVPPEGDSIPTFRLEVAAMSPATATTTSSTANTTSTASSSGSTTLPDDYDDDDVSSFSVDQCADIVDNILGDVDDSVFCRDSLPPMKKARVV